MNSPVPKLAKANVTAKPRLQPATPKKTKHNSISAFFGSLKPLDVTLIVSALLHLVLIFALRFEAPELKVIKDKMLHLDVVLVNSKTKSKPNKADAFAQANLDRGGNTDAKRQMKSALPVKQSKAAEATLKPAQEAKAEAALAQKEAEVVREQKRVEALEKQSQALLTQLKSLKHVETQATKQEKKPDSDKSEQISSAKIISAADLVAMDMEMQRLEAQIAKQQEEYQSRPKRKFIGARTQEYRFALYVEAWRQKVEKIGTLNFPEEAKEQKLYGKLRMTVSIKSDGTIEDIEINQSSGHKVLDNAAKRIVELGAPYAPFSDEVRKDTDIISITRTWTFTRQDSLATE